MGKKGILNYIVKGMCIMLMLALISGCGSSDDSGSETDTSDTAAEESSDGGARDFSTEVVTMEIVSRHWDATEMEGYFGDFSNILAEGGSIDDYIVDDISADDIQSIKDYFAEFEGGDVKYVYTGFQTFYKVEAEDDYNDLRGMLEYKFSVTEGDTVTEHTVLMKMARLGDADGVSWQIYEIMWYDNGVDVSDVDLFQLEQPESGEEVCVMTTDVGVIKMRLFPEQAPLAVENWIGLAKEGFYDGTEFGRVIEEFVIQGGALDGSGDESISYFDGFYEDEVQRGLYNFNGALCLGNNGPHTNGNQYYIVQNTEPDIDLLPRLSLPGNVETAYAENGGLPVLDGRYTVFGQVYEGMDVVLAIAQQETDDDDAPLSNPVKVVSVTFETIE